MQNRRMGESRTAALDKCSHGDCSSPELIPFILHVFTYTIIYIYLSIHPSILFKSTDILNVKGPGLQSFCLILAVLDALQF